MGWIPRTRSNRARAHAVNFSKRGLPDAKAVIDGEICSLDKRGRPQFTNLLFHRGNYPCFLAFDLLMCDHKDCRRESLLDRKQELRRLRSGSDARIQYVDYVDGIGCRYSSKRASTIWKALLPNKSMRRT
jgi:ATP-dependent DNA ligase